MQTYRNVVHRDLKLENLLLATPDDITQVHALVSSVADGKAREREFI